MEVGLRAEREQPWEKWSPLPQTEKNQCSKIAMQTLWACDVPIRRANLLISKHHASPMGGKRWKGLCSKLQKQTATCRWSQCGFFSCKGVWEHWPVCSQNSKEIDNPGRYLYWGRSFLTGNRQSSSTNSPPVIDCLVFWGMWAAREEGCWTCKELIPSSGESKLMGHGWRWRWRLWWLHGRNTLTWGRNRLIFVFDQEYRR